MRGVKIGEEECEVGMAWERIKRRSLRREKTADGTTVSRRKDEIIHLQDVRKPR